VRRGATGGGGGRLRGLSGEQAGTSGWEDHRSLIDGQETETPAPVSVQKLREMINSHPTFAIALVAFSAYYNLCDAHLFLLR